MQILNRKVTFRLYPNATQSALLMETLALHCRTYNALLEEHQRRFEAGESPFNFAAMCKDLTLWRGYAPSLASLGAQAMQVTAKRVALAFAAFFRRVKAGETPGYPRFKSLSRFSGWGYKTYGDGWKLGLQLTSQGFHYDRLKLPGIGDIRMRGKGRFVGTPKTAEIQHKNGKWYVSVTFKVAEERLARPGGDEVAAFDWGVTTLLTIAKADGSIETIENLKFLKQSLVGIKALQKAASAEESRLRVLLDIPAGQGVPYAAQSKKLRRIYAQIGKVHAKVARQRHDFYHKLTAMLVERFGFLGTEELDVVSMTETPEAIPDPAQPGQFLPNGAGRQAANNRGVLDAAPSKLLNLIRYKAVEAGSEYVEANTKVVKPTQRCHRCGTLTKKTLADRMHVCGNAACGEVCGRDENAAKTLLRWMVEGNFWSGTDQVGERTVPVRPPETPPIATAPAGV